MKYNVIESKEYKNIQEKYHVNSLLAKVLDCYHYDHNILETLLNPRLIYHDFALFEEAEMTLDRIQEAIENNEKICNNYSCTMFFRIGSTSRIPYS